jgi:hypothetical protein
MKNRALHSGVRPGMAIKLPKPPAKPQRDWGKFYAQKYPQQWGQAYAQGSSYQPKGYTRPKTVPQSLKRSQDRRDKRLYIPGCSGGIRPDFYMAAFDYEKNGKTYTYGGSLPYQQYRLDMLTGRGVMPLTVNTWVAEQLGYADLLKAAGYKINTDLDAWVAPTEIWRGDQYFPNRSTASTGYSGYGGGGYSGYGGGGGGRGRGGGGGGGSLGGYNEGISPATTYSGRGVAPSMTGRQMYSPSVSWRI